MLKSFKIKIRGDDWVIILLPDHTFDSKFGAGTEAITIYDSKKKFIYFKPEGISKETVVHEVTHAFMSYLHLGSAKLKLEQVEEIFCEFLSFNIGDLSRVAGVIHRKLRDWT